MTITLGLAVKKLVEFDLGPSRTIKLLDWENVVGEFMFQAHSFCVLANIFKDERRHLHELQITFDTISQLLKNQGDFSVEDDLEKKAAKVGECSKDRKRKMIEPLEETTPKVQEKKMKFVKVSPKALDLLDKFRCTVCEREFVHLKSLKRHLKTDHNLMVVPENLKEKKDLITCKKCMKKCPRDQMQRHLQLAHKISKVNRDKKSSFRGWLSFNDDDWHPVWLDIGEEDPVEEMMVPVQGNVVNLYGVQYDLKSVDTDEEQKIIKLEPVLELQQVETISGGSNPTSKVELNTNQNLSLQEKGSKDSKVHLIPDDPGVFTDEMFSGNEPVKSNSADARRKVSVIDSEDHSAIHDALKEEINDSRKYFKELGVDILECSDDDEPRSPKCFLGKETNGGVDKPENKDGQKLKVRVFSDEDIEGDFWSVDCLDKEDSDSDYENGDSESFTKARLAMKKQRFDYCKICF